jgi:hypothetical protein
VAMATQEIHYASMAQELGPLLVDTSVTWDSKKLRSMVPSQARIAMPARMTNFHRNWLGSACQWM